MKSILGSWIRILNLVKMSFPTNWYILNATHLKSQHFFSRTLQADSKIHTKCKGYGMAKITLKKKKVGRFILPELETI